MNRIDKKFMELKKKNQKAFIAFVTAGFPDLKTTQALVEEFSRKGVDIVELGVPFSDPMADGPIIQYSSQAALKKGVSLKHILKLVERLRRKTDIPICLMSYYNPIFSFGQQRFFELAQDSGVDGLIIPDLSFEEALMIRGLAKRHSLCLIPFLAPTTSEERMRRIDKAASGFIYYVSLTGVTGARQRLPSDLMVNLKKVKDICSHPVCVGFGVSFSHQIRDIYRIADGVIVGSAIVKKIIDFQCSKDLVKRVSGFVSNLKSRGG